MKRTAINPWPWSLEYGFSQGELVEGQPRILFCSGQTALNVDGIPQHAGDIHAQFTLALDNLERVLKGADMTLANIVHLTIYTVDVDSLIQNMDVLGECIGAAGVKPAETLLGINRLAFPELLVELEATAVA
jgi:enamine deaminase RidA (YjgF/YER057c/UK114 family)